MGQISNVVGGLKPKNNKFYFKKAVVVSNEPGYYEK